MIATSLEETIKTRESEEHIEEQLRAYNPLSFRDVSVRARRDAVVLSGEVPSFYARSVAGHVVRRLIGSAELVDVLQVRRIDSQTGVPASN